MGITFKENCNDARNSKMVEIYNLLLKKGARIDVYDPNAINNEVKSNFGIDLIKLDGIKKNSYEKEAKLIVFNYFFLVSGTITF